MRCWAYTVIRNESLLLPYWLRHYRTYCERMVVYDDNSDDGSAAIAVAAGADLRPYPYNGFDDFVMVDFANHTYREARGYADFILWVDADEFLVSSGASMRDRLERLQNEGITLPRVQGYAMLADAPPAGEDQIYDELPYGFPHNRYSKPCILDPSLDLTWDIGKHTAYVSGSARTNDDEPLKLLHYRYLGQAYHEERNARNWGRTPRYQRDLRVGYETAPDWDGEYSARWYEEQRHLAVRVC